MHNNKTQETRDTNTFPWGNHKGENPATSLQIEWAPIAVVKPENIKMISTASISLSHIERASPLSPCAPMSECVCVINRESHSLFIFFHSREAHSNMSSSLNNYLLEPTSLKVSNNPIAPQLMGTLPSAEQRGLTLTYMVGTIAPTYNNSPRVDFYRIV